MITILEAALAFGAQQNSDGSISMEQFDRVGLPFFAGCQRCEASLGPAQSYPSKSGYIRCKDCIGDSGFETTAEFRGFTPPV